MAKNDEKTPDFEIEMYRPDEAGGHYEAHVQALITGDEKRTPEQVAAGEHASIKVTFPKELDGKPQVEKHKRWFRESAGARNLSAKVVEEVDKGDSVEVRYIVVPKITRPRKANDETGAADESDAPADESDVPAAA